MIMGTVTKARGKCSSFEDYNWLVTFKHQKYTVKRNEWKLQPLHPHPQPPKGEEHETLT